MLRAAGGECLLEIVQNKPDPDFWISRGRLREIQNVQGANTVIADGDLSSRQARNLLRETGLEPLDRTMVVLHIFALRARSAQSKLQVEAAQLEHIRGQLRGMWPHLERTGGGIGTRGPGETQLETDRRLLDKRIRHLRRGLEATRYQGQKERRERLRSGLLRATLWGYTNSGKTSLAAALGASGASSSPEVFATLDPQTRRVRLRTHSLLLTDTVGIIDHMPEEILAAFRSTLEEIEHSDLLIHVLWGERWKKELRYGETLLEDLGLEDRPRLLVVNGPARGLPRGAVHIKSDPQPLREALEQDFLRRSREVRLLFPHYAGKDLSRLYTQSAVLERQDAVEGVRIRARILPEREHLFQAFFSA